MSPLELLALSIGCYLVASLISLLGSGKQEEAVMSLTGVISTIGAFLV